MRITEFYVSNFRSLSEVSLRDLGGFNVVVGYNGYGKTNLLSSIFLFIKNLAAGIEKRAVEDRNQEFILLWQGYNVSKPITLGGKVEFSADEVNKIIGKNQKVTLEVVNKIKYVNNYVEWSLDTLYINGSPPGEDDLKVARKLAEYAAQGVEYVPIFDQIYFDEILKRMTDMNKSPINLRKYWYDFVNLVSATIPEVKGMEFWDGRRLVLNVYNLPIYIDLAASGFQRVILMLFIIWLSGNKILLIEEPEVNMHPTLQAKIMKLIKSWTDNGVLQAFLTTHSPYIVEMSADTYIVMRRVNGNSTAITVKPTADLKGRISLLNSSLSNILFSRIIILTSELAEPSVVINWLKRLNINVEDNGISVFKVSSDLELQHWLKLKNMLSLDVIFLGLCDKLDMSLKDYCVPLSREVENFYSKQALLDVLRNLGIYPDEKEIRELGKEDNLKWIINVLRKRGIEYDKLRMSIGELITSVDSVEIPKEIEILANKIKSLQAVL
ncbi:MAG: ATP/GTP-binding protein [Saccharolobus sp.]|uniref:ATP-dependent nuclease n=1 Tax=Saccharolobus sp. TaxID=2100761 RepID=UPI0028CEE53E|nr:ATP/GTP-binding protein [Saccharolobus sp.]MDT7861727.1 ATP/GTP-binding protein [Saccharolobus sp.]